MTPPADKVDMAQLNVAIDKVIAVPARPKPARQKHTQRDVERPPPAKSGKTANLPARR